MTSNTTEEPRSVLRLEKALLAIDRVTAREIVPGEGGDAFAAVVGLVVPVLERIGDGWDQGRFSLSQVYMAGRLCEGLVDELLPPTDPARVDQPRMAIAVLEDHHLLGLRIVYSALRASGYSLGNYGRVTVDELVHKVADDGIRILLISTLMLPAALRIRDLAARLAESGAPPQVIVGGAPFRFDPQLAGEVGADHLGTTAADAVAIVRSCVEGGVR